MKTSVSHLLIIVLIVLAAFGIASAWTTPVPLTEVNTRYEGWAFISSDNSTLYFTRSGTPGHYWNQLYQATRTPSGSFSNVTAINELTGDHVGSCWVSPDNRNIYYYTTSSGWQIKKSTRATTSDPWGSTQDLTELNSFGDVISPRLSADELTIVFNQFQNQTTGAIYTASRSDRNSQFTNIRAVSELNTTDVRDTFLSADGLTLYFTRNDSGVFHNYLSTRSSITGTFGTAQLLNYWPENYNLSCFSADGQTAYLGYNGDIYVSQIPEPVTLILLGLGGVLIRKRG